MISRFGPAGTFAFCGALVLMLLACDSGTGSEVKTVIKPRLGLSADSLKKYSVDKNDGADGSSTVKPLVVKGLLKGEDGSFSLQGMFTGPSEKGWSYELLGENGGNLVNDSLTEMEESVLLKVTNEGKELFVKLFFGREWSKDELSKLTFGGQRVVSVKEGAEGLDFQLNLASFSLAAESAFEPVLVGGPIVLDADAVELLETDLGEHACLEEIDGKFVNILSDPGLIADRSFTLALSRRDYRKVKVLVKVTSEAYGPQHPQVRALTLAGVPLSAFKVLGDSTNLVLSEAVFRRNAGWEVPAAVGETPGSLSLRVGGVLPGWKVMFAPLPAGDGGAPAFSLSPTEVSAQSSSDERLVVFNNTGNTSVSLLGNKLLLMISPEGEGSTRLSVEVTFKGNAWRASELASLTVGGWNTLLPVIVEGRGSVTLLTQDLAASTDLDLTDVAGGASYVPSSFRVDGLGDDAIPDEWFKAGGEGDGVLSFSEAKAADFFAGKKFKLSLSRAGSADLELTFTFAEGTAFTATEVDKLTLAGLQVSGYDAIAKTAFLALPEKAVAGGLNLSQIGGDGAQGFFFMAGTFVSSTLRVGRNGRVHAAVSKPSLLSTKDFKATLRKSGRADTEITFTFQTVASLTGATLGGLAISSYDPDADTATLALPGSWPLASVQAYVNNSANVTLKTNSFDGTVGEDPITADVLANTGVLSNGTDVNVKGKTFQATFENTSDPSVEGNVVVIFTFPLS